MAAKQLPLEVAMIRPTLSRRQFSRIVGTGLGAALLGPKFPSSSAEAREPVGMPPGAIQINSNENPYGPSPQALQAMTRSERIASRYPDALEARLAEAIAKLHGVEPANILLGCGSGEILRVADMAFLGREKNVVVAE